MYCPLCRLSRFALPLFAVIGLAAALALNAPQKAAEPKSSASAAASVFVIDDVHSMALFRVQHMGAGQFWGRFNDVTGEVKYEEGKMLSFDVSVDVGTVDSGNDKLNAHLKSPDFFNTVEFPKMSFKSTNAKSIGGGRFEVSGKLSIHGVTKEVTVTIDASKIATMGGKTRAGFEGTFDIKRSDYGMTYGVEQGSIGDQVRIIIAVEAIAASI
jgi:polyisoprenoid-binding protein YceI